MRKCDGKRWEWWFSMIFNIFEIKWTWDGKRPWLSFKNVLKEKNNSEWKPN